MIYVLHHDDMDGYAAAWVAKKALGEVKCIEVNYKQPVPEIPDGSDVYILDFCFPKEEMLVLKEKCASLTVIDHHITHKDTLEGTGITHIFDVNESGASLTWKYFFKDAPMPEWLKIVRVADIWKWNEYPGAKEIANFFYTKPLSHEFVEEISNTDVKSMLSIGKSLLDYKMTLVQMIDKLKYVMMIDEFKVMAANTASLSSDVGNYLFNNRGECAFGCTYSYSDGMVKFSLRSIGDIDVSLVAKRFGGGGHKNAAGFSVPMERFSFVAVSSK